jgi:hypothetical protein
MTPEQRIQAYGIPDQLPKKNILKAGQLELTYENGIIRWIKIGNTEILRMIYSAVRDRNWGTIEPKIEEEILNIDEHSFDICLKVNYDADPIHFSADYRISGAENKIRFEMNGIAQSDFLKNRIGFCILHPITERARKKAMVGHPDGTYSDFVFPEQISDTQPAKNIQSMQWEPESGMMATLNLSGDIFEMEDQRNWTDASYKTYCTPLEIPFPSEIKKGETVSQVVELLVEAKPNAKSKANEFIFMWNTDHVSKLPELGTSISSRKESLTLTEIGLLEKLPLQHLRVELKPRQIGFKELLHKTTRESELLGWPVFAVLFLSSDYPDEYQQFAENCKVLKTSLKYLLLVGENHLSFEAFNELESQIRYDFPGILLGTGVNAYFAELNRNRPAIEKADFVSFTICPQVHAFDHATLVENLEAQAEVVKSARLLFPGKPIFVSPVSLRQRFNVVATAPETEPPSGVLPSSVDVRQASVFAASWTLGSLKFLAQSGASLATYFETVGWKGLIQGDIQSDCPEKFISKANDVFPVFYALKSLSGFPEVIHSKSSHPLQFDGLVVRSESEIKVFLFSFSSEELEIKMNPEFHPKEIWSLLYSSEPKRIGKNLQLKAWDLLVISL